MAEAPEVTFTPRRWWTGPFDVEQLAWSSVVRARDAASELAAARDLDFTVDTTPELVAASFSAIEHLRIDGRVPQPWGEFSGFVAARDGWVRLHGNYPHHAEVLRRVLGVQDRAGLECAISRRDAAELEEEVTAAGGIAARVRTRQEWARHPQAQEQQDGQWLSATDRGERPALPPSASISKDSAPALLAGVRVLDLTRVIAGPSGTQLLACLGADVLRIDPPHLPELLDQHLSTGMGKRSAVLDLREREDADQLRALAAGADVILDGYRPGALAAHGLGTGDLAQIAPQAVIVSLSAWGEHGPWGRHAGFDSIVQAATGIAARCGSRGRPGALPVQALDHASGQRIAAHVMESLARGRATTIGVNLLGAARTLLAAPPPEDPGAPVPLEVPLRSVPSLAGELEVVPPPLTLDGRTLERDVGSYGAARAEWVA